MLLSPHSKNVDIVVLKRRLMFMLFCSRRDLNILFGPELYVSIIMRDVINSDLVIIKAKAESSITAAILRDCNH